MVCLAGAGVWWKMGRRKIRWYTLPDRLVGTLQLFFQLTQRYGPSLQAGCAWVSIEDFRVDGQPPTPGGERAAYLSSHRASGPQLPATFMWPEFDYEARLLGYNPPLPMLQRAAWSEPVPWERRNQSAYGRASLEIDKGRRRIRACAAEEKAFADGRVQVSDLTNDLPVTLRRECGTTGAADSTYYHYSCHTRWTIPPANYLDHYRQHRFNLYLPGQQDWSTTFQILMSLGGALLVPDDLTTVTLWSSVLNASCAACTISYSRAPSVCQGILHAISTSDSVAEATAARLHTFVHRELNEACVYQYMREVWNGLHHMVVPTVEELKNLNFSLFDCKMQHELVSGLGHQRFLSDNEEKVLYSGLPRRHHDAYYDAETCRRRERPKPLPFFVKCKVRNRNESGYQLEGRRERKDWPNYDTALSWC
ncbi:MAG: hypothetical protein SGPRY_014213 [Prymnesium sp.]